MRRNLRSDPTTLDKERRERLSQSSRQGAVAERAFIEWAKAQSLTPSKRGWPDFLMVEGDDVIAVEVKQHRFVPLSADQHRVTQALIAYGIRCCVWSPDRPVLTPIVSRQRRRTAVNE